MKKIISLFLILLLMLLGFNIGKEVKAISLNFEYGNISPRFQYLEDDSGDLILFEGVIYDMFDTPEDIESIDIVLEQVTYEGEFLKNLKIFEIDYELYNSSISTLTSDPFIAGDDIYFEEYLYVKELNYVTINSVYVNGLLLSSGNWELDEAGEFIKLTASSSDIGDSITVMYRYENSTSYKDILNYDWSGLNFVFDEVLFYRVRYNEFILFTGAVMETPKAELTYDTYNIEFGRFISQDNGLVDFSEQSDFTSYLDEEDYWILHYRIPEGLINVGQYKNIRIRDINSNTLEEGFNTNNILSLQGGSDYNFANSFIIIPLTETLGEGLIITNDFLNSRYDYFLHDYPEGSYFIAIEDQLMENDLLASASVVWNIVEDENPFELILLKDEISIIDLQRVTFLKTSELFSSTYNTTLAKDYGLAVSYVDEINATDYTYAISYYLEQDTITDVCILVGWTLEPVFVPYELNVEDYSINLRDQYCTIEETDIAGHINNSLIYYALDDEVGSVIFVIFVLIFANTILILSTKATFIYAFVNLVVVLILAFMGLIPMWLILGLFILGFIGFKISLSGGGISYE